MRRARPAGLALLLFLALRAPSTEATGVTPYVGPFIVVGPGDVRVAALTGATPSALSPNSPGLLLDVPPSRFADPLAEESARSLVAAARRSGWRSGLAVDLPDTEVPKEPRAAEVTTPESLYPGLGRLITAARGADLFVLGFPGLEEEDLPARRFVLRKIAAAIRAENPDARIALVFHAAAAPSLFPPVARELLRDDVAAYVDLVGLHAADVPPDPAAFREAADAMGAPGPLLLVGPERPGAASLLDLAARFAPQRVTVVAAPVSAPAPGDAALLRFGRLLSGDFGPDTRVAVARTADGRPLSVHRFVSGADLGGVVLLPGVDAGGVAIRGEVRLTLDSPSYASFLVTELATGRSATFDIPKTRDAPILTLSTRSGPLTVTLTPRERSPAEAPRAQVEAAAPRGITAEEILARHQAWRAARDARWRTLSARNTSAYRIRLAELNTSTELTFSGSFFYEPGKGYDWVWEEAFFNGVKWPSKKVPEVPLLQPEKVSELPLELTFGDAYRYQLVGEDDVRGEPCWRLSFVPVSDVGERPIYEGDVWISRRDYAPTRVRSRQRNVKGEIQSADETVDFGEVGAADGGPALRFPVHVTGRTIFSTFSRSTVIERETRLTDVVLDDPAFETRKSAALASERVMVRDTQAGVRYLEKTKEGERKPADRARSSQLFGLAGVLYDPSYGHVLPLLGAYYIDLDVKGRGDQTQILFGGILLAGSWNRPGLFGTKLEAGADVFGIAVRGTDTPWVNGEKDESQSVRSRNLAGALNLAWPVVPHLKLAATFAASHRDYAAADTTAPGFVVPSDHWLLSAEGRLLWDFEGYSLVGRFGWNRRTAWEAWGIPGNPDYDPGKASYRNWDVTVAKDFALPSFQRITASATWAGTENADRFSKLTFGSFGGYALIGFASGSLRAERTVILQGAYGLMLTRVFRLAAEYDHAFVWDAPSGYAGTSFGGAGLTGQFPAPWSTLVRLTAGLPVVGRDKGQTGYFLSLEILKIF